MHKFCDTHSVQHRSKLRAASYVLIRFPHFPVYPDMASVYKNEVDYHSNCSSPMAFDSW